MTNSERLEKENKLLKEKLKLLDISSIISKFEEFDLGNRVKNIPKYTTISRKADKWYVTTEDKPSGVGDTLEEAMKNAGL